MPLQNSLSADNLPFLASKSLNRALSSNSESLESRLRAVVVIVALENINVESDTGGLTEAVECVWDHLSREVPDLGILEAEVPNEEGAGGDIDDGAGEGFIEGSMGVPKAAETLAITESFAECFSNAEKGVFSCMVVVDCKAKDC